MALVYIDTNVFLDFYQTSTDRLAVFEEIERCSKSVLLTQQTVNEFRRNRISCLTVLAGLIRKAPDPQLHTTAVVQELPGFKEWVEARDAAKKAAQEIAKELSSWVAKEESDPVLTAFEMLVASAKVVGFDDALVERARRRKDLGQPPTSPDKHTIGDEVIWESLMTWKDDDLVIVTRDKSYLNNRTILEKEFFSATGKKLIEVTTSLATGLKTVGQDWGKIEEAEMKLRSIPDEHAFRTPEGWTVVSSGEGFATVTDGRRGGVVSTARNPHYSWQCPNCGNFGPWSGVICLSCGRMSDPAD